MRTTPRTALPGVLMASVLATGIAPPLAAAQTPPPVEYTAVGNDDCSFTVSFVNRTNSQYYQIDYRIDGEEPRGSQGPVEIYRYGPWPNANQPVFPEQTNNYIFNGDPVESVKNRSIRNVPELPNPEQDSHQVDVRIAVGPDARHRLPEWRTIEVSGCLTETTLALSGPTATEIGEEVTFEVAVAPEGVTGTVQFYDGDEPIGGPVTVEDDMATLTHVFAEPGSHPITARLSADGQFADSVSESLTVIVPEAPPVPGTGSLGSAADFEVDLGSTGSLMQISGMLNAGSGR